MARTDYGAILSTVITGTSQSIRNKEGTTDLIAPVNWSREISRMNHSLVDTTSGSICSFDDGADNVPIKLLQASISGTGCNVVNTTAPVAPLWTIDRSFNGHTNFNQMNKNNKGAQTANGVTMTTNSDGTATISGTNDGTGTSWLYFMDSDSGHPFVKDHIYLLYTGSYYNDKNVFVYAVGGSGKSISSGKNYRFDKAVESEAGSSFVRARVASGTSVTGTVTVTAQLFDLTQMFGATIADYIYNLDQSEEGAGLAFFRSVYSNNYYAYNAGTDELVGASEGTTYPISWSTEVGTVTSGTMQVNADGTIDVTSGGTTTRLTSVVDIRTLLGTNNIYCDTGNISNLTYYMDMDLYIQSGLIEETVASAPVASFSDGMKAYPLKELSLSINPTQSGSGDPYPAGGGKNKFNCSANYNLPINNKNGVTVTLGDDGLLHFSGTCTTNFSIYGINQSYYGVVGTPIKFTVFGASDTLPCVPFKNNYSTTAITTDGGTSTTLANAEGDVFYLRIDLKAGTNYTGKTLGIVFSLASEPITSFIPYSNIRPITGVSSVNVENWGKYIRALPTTAQSVTNNGITFTIKSNGQVDINGTATALASATIPVTPFTVFSDDGRTIRFHNTFALSTSNVVFKNGGTTVDSWNLGVLDRTYTNFSALAGKYVDTIQISIPSGATINGSLMVDFNVSGTGNTYIIALGDTYYGATLDVVRGKLSVDRGLFLLSDITLSYAPNSGKPYVYAIVSDYYGNGSYTVAVSDCICSMLPAIKRTSIMDNGTGFQIESNHGFYIADNDIDKSLSAQDFINAIQTKYGNAQFCCLLTTPIEIDLTPTQINSRLGQNHIWHDGNGDTSCAYYANGQLYVEQHST